MKKIGLMVCGNSGIDYIEHEYDIPVIRSILLIGEKEYTDFVDISAEEFYQMLEDKPSLTPSTSQASTGMMVEQYKAMRDKGYDELLVVSISQKLSGTYENAMLATKLVGDYKVTVFDSNTVSYPQAKMILDAAKMVQEGKTLEQIISRLEFIRDNHVIWFAVDTLRYLVKNGRLSNASGFVGSLLKLKPLLTVTKEGKIESIEKIRTTSKATKRVIEKFLEETKDKNIEPFIIHGHAPKRVQHIREQVLEARPDLTEIKDYPLTPVVGAHAGPKVVGLGYILRQ